VLFRSLARREHSPEERAEVVLHLSQLIVKKLLHLPTTVLRSSSGDTLQWRVEAVTSMFGLQVPLLAPEGSGGGEASGGAGTVGAGADDEDDEDDERDAAARGEAAKDRASAPAGRAGAGIERKASS
jgi:hypothetical protein